MSFPDIHAFGLTSRTYWNYSRRYIATRKSKGVLLYDRQRDALTFIQRELPVAGTVLISAYMSFGKTLLGLETALWLVRENPKSFATIIVPGTVFKTWGLEVKKHYSKVAGMNITGRIPDRKILVKTPTILKWLDKLKMQEDDRFPVPGEEPKDPYWRVRKRLAGKVFVASTAGSKGDITTWIIKNSCGFVIDEAHRYADQVAEILGYNKPTVLLGASVPKKIKGVPIYKAPVPQVVMPALEYRLECCIPDSPIRTSKKHPRELIIRRIDPTKNTIIMYSAEASSEADNIRRAVGDVGVYQYWGKQVTQYRKYLKTGGVLLCSIGSIAEGTNFNKCNELFIEVPESISLKRLQQAIGRVCRQSSTTDKVVVHLFSSNYSGYIRSKVAQLSLCTGYDVDTGPLEHKVRRLGDRLVKLTMSELVAIFCIKESAESKLGIPLELTTLTIQEYMDIMMDDYS